MKTVFPDGQMVVKVDEYKKKIYHRINSYDDLIELVSIAEAYNHAGVNLGVIIPCLFGQRSDRRFDDKESFGLKVITNIINSCNFSWVALFDPHSDVGPALIDRSYVLKEVYDEIISFTLEKFDRKNLVLVSPDAGAYKKIFSIAEKHDLPLVAANKFRDKEGKISLNFSGDVEGKDCLIIDDMAEFGNTFINLAKQLKDNGASNVNLYVSHFLGGGDDNYVETINRLSTKIDRIFTTNSIRDFSHEKVVVYPLFLNA